MTVKAISGPSLEWIGYVDYDHIEPLMSFLKICKCIFKVKTCANVFERTCVMVWEILAVLASNPHFARREESVESYKNSNGNDT